MRSVDLDVLVVLGLVEYVTIRLTDRGRRWLKTSGEVVRLTPEGEREKVLDTPDGQGAALLFAPHAGAYVWTDELRALRSPARIPGEAREPGARVFRTWTRGRAPRGAHDLELDLEGLAWVRLGAALEIAYKSSKFNRRGRLVRFIHEHDPRVHCYGAERARARMFAVQGARITSAGIVG